MNLLGVQGHTNLLRVKSHQALVSEERMRIKKGIQNRAHQRQKLEESCSAAGTFKNIICEIE